MSSEDESPISVVSMKGISVVVLFGVALLGGWLPLRIRSRDSPRTQRFLSFGNTIAGGIFLTTGLVHMLSSAAEGLGVGFGFPLAYILALVGMLSMLVIEAWTTAASATTATTTTKSTLTITPPPTLSSAAALADSSSSRYVGNLSYSNNSNTDQEYHNNNNNHHHHHHHHHHHSHIPHQILFGSGDDSDDATVIGRDGNFEGGVTSSKSESDTSTIMSPRGRPSSDVPAAKYDTRQSARIVPYILAFLMSAHSLIEGTALGLEYDAVQAAQLFGAVLFHKFFDSFAVGTSLTRIRDRRELYLIVLLAAMTPAGILCGTLLNTAMRQQQVATSFQYFVVDSFKALAAGTFIHVGLVEVITHELRNGRDTRMKVLFLIATCVVVSIPALLE